MYLHPGTEPNPILQVRIRRRKRLHSAKTTGTGPFPRSGTAIPWLRFGAERFPIHLVALRSSQILLTVQNLLPDDNSRWTKNIG